MAFAKKHDVISTGATRKEKSHPREKGGNSESLGEGEISRGACPERSVGLEMTRPFPFFHEAQFDDFVVGCRSFQESALVRILSQFRKKYEKIVATLQ